MERHLDIVFQAAIGRTDRRPVVAYAVRVGYDAVAGARPGPCVCDNLRLWAESALVRGQRTASNMKDTSIWARN